MESNGSIAKLGTTKKQVGSYAVANAVDELKAVSTSVIDSNENDGVAKWLLENAKFGADADE